MFHVKHRKVEKMIKRFEKRGRYTLCLIQGNEWNDINTWCVNALYLKQDKEWRYFTTPDKLYKINKNNNMVHILWTEIVYEGENDCSFNEWDEIECFDFAHCTNIVKGWQF